MKLSKNQSTVRFDLRKPMTKYFWEIIEYKTDRIRRHEHRMYDITEMIGMYHQPDFFNRSVTDAMVQAEIQNDRVKGR